MLGSRIGSSENLNFDVRLALSHFGLLEHLEERGAELSGWCPFGDEHGKLDGLWGTRSPFVS